MGVFNTIIIRYTYYYYIFALTALIIIIISFIFIFRFLLFFVCYTFFLSRSRHTGGVVVVFRRLRHTLRRTDFIICCTHLSGKAPPTLIWLPWHCRKAVRTVALRRQMASRYSFQANHQLKNVCLVHRAVCDFCIAPARLDLRDACYFCLNSKST